MTGISWIRVSKANEYMVTHIYVGRLIDLQIALKPL